MFCCVTHSLLGTPRVCRWCRELLVTFYQKNRRKPARIVFYRSVPVATFMHLVG